MKNIGTIILGLSLMLSFANADSINIKLKNTEVYKNKDCTSYVVEADKLEKKYIKSDKSSYRVNTNRLENIEFIYTKFLVCQKLKEMNK